MHLSQGHNEDGELSELNVTPFIDVMLVLLIIFMVAAPLSTVNIPVDLPTASTRTAPPPDKPTVVTMKADLALSVGETETSWTNLEADVGVSTHFNFEQRIYVRADKSVSYGDIMRLFNGLRAAGYLKLALVSQDAATLPHAANPAK